MSNKTQQQEPNNYVKTILNMVSGGIAGAVSRTATSPIERLKVLQQVQAKGETQYSGIVQGLRAMYQKEGWKGYFKGNGSNVARIAPYSALQFMFFDVYKNAISHLGFGEKITNPDGTTSTQASSFQRLAAGALAGSTSTLFCYPLDLVRSYLTVQTTQSKYNGIFDCLKQIYLAEGIRGWFRGSLITLAGITPYIAINFYVFDTLKHHFLPKDPNDPSFPLINFAIGGISGGTAALMTYPSDVVRRRIQLMGTGKHLVEGMVGSTKVVDCVRQIVKAEGIPGLYRGLNACLLKVIPSMAISFSIHENLRHRLDFDYKKPATTI